MIDFTKKIKNSNKFRQAAIAFQRTGQFCPYPQGTTEYFKFWDEETKRSLDGYYADDGDFISGYNYFYINYCPIERITHVDYTDKHGKHKLRRVRKLEFPDFYDYDYYYFSAVEEAETTGKHLAVLKSRRKGYSYKAGGMMCRNFYLIPGSKSYAYASNKQYLTEDGILTKAWSFMDFIDTNTPWAKKRQVTNSTMHKKASFFVTDDYGNKVEVGYKSEIIGLSLKDNPDVVRGKAGKLILFEEAGSFSELAAAWQIARPSVEQDGITFGIQIAFGTGGDKDSNFSALKNMFYSPDGFNCIGFPNIWDNNAGDKPCGFFIPQHTNLDVRDDKGRRLYMDEDGNTLHKKAVDYIMAERQLVIQNATSSNTVDRFVAEHAETPQEACLEFNGNIFPKKEMQDHLSYIRTHKAVQAHKQVGDLSWAPDGTIKWTVKQQGDIVNYPLPRDQDPKGSVVIWEHPIADAPHGLYIGGCDPWLYAVLFL